MKTPPQRLYRFFSLPLLAAVTATALLAGACDGAQSSQPPGATTAVQAPTPATQSGDVLATVGGDEVTLEDLRDIIGEQLSQMDFEYRSQRHRVIDTAMRRYVREQVLEAEAEERGIALDALLEEVVGDQVSVSDDDVRMFYLQRQSQLQGRTFESIAPQIRQFLETQQRDSLIEEFTEGVAEKHGARFLLEPFRVDIDISNAPVLGPEDAPATLVEFSDFECPYCESFVPTLDRVKEEYGDRVKIAFRHFPLRQIHPNAQVAAEASMCVYDQGKFWEAHDLFFAEQEALGEADLRDKAERLGLDTEVFDECFESGKYVDLIDEDMADGIAVGVTGTPAIFVNGRPLPGGAVPFEMVAELIDDELERIER